MPHSPAPPDRRPPLRCGGLLALVLAPLLLAGCASFSADGGHDTVAQLAQAHTGQPLPPQRTDAERSAAQARVAELLARPLTADSAVAVALLNHRGLQARLAAVGIAEADLVRASQPAALVFGLDRLHGGGTVSIDRALGIDLLGLLTLPQARAAGRQRFSQAQWQAAADTVALAGEARRAFHDAVAAQQLAGYLAQVREAADTSAELGRRMAEAGNFSPLAQLREQAFQADALTRQTLATQQALAARERLWRLLGIDGRGPVPQLPDRLPDLPVQLPPPPDLAPAALARRLDVQQARQAVDAAALALDQVRGTRFVDGLHASVRADSASGEPRHNGFGLELGLPLFDGGAARIARAEAVLRQAQHRAAQGEIDARSELREAHAATLAAHALALHQRDTVVPLRKRISDELLLRYNGMLASVFDLLADAQVQIGAVTQSVAALHAYWTAESRLQAALAGVPAGGSAALSGLGAAGTEPGPGSAPAGH